MDAQLMFFLSAWLLSFVALWGLTVGLLRFCGARSLLELPAKLRQLHRNQVGASYVMSYMMVIPVYMMLMLAIFEFTLMTISKLGTQYSAYVGARVAVVRFGTESGNATRARIQVSVRRAMIPFASGMHRGSEQVPNLPGSGLYASEITSRTSDLPISDSYLQKKYSYSALATNATTSVSGDSPRRWNEEIKVTVTYLHPIHFPFVGRIFGLPSIGGRYAYPIQSEATLPFEGPENTEMKLGIGYASR